MNGLELVQAAQQEWARNHGSESLYGYCQRFDGWYVQWAWMGFQNDWEIITYSSAQAAANESSMFAWNVNDSRIDAGDLLYWEYYPYGHVATAVGWDGGRLLVSQTGNGGDSYMYLGNNVKISHADTITLPFIGASKTNGRNPERTGVTNYGGGGGDGGQTLHCPPDGIYWYNTAWDAQAMQNVHGHTYTNEPLLEGSYTVLGTDPNGAYNILANDGSHVWMHSSMGVYVS